MDAQTVVTVVSLILNTVQVLYLATLKSRATKTGRAVDEYLDEYQP
jgi:hypothetical protein